MRQVVSLVDLNDDERAATWHWQTHMAGMGSDLIHIIYIWSPSIDLSIACLIYISIIFTAFDELWRQLEIFTIDQFNKLLSNYYYCCCHPKIKHLQQLETTTQAIVNVICIMFNWKQLSTCDHLQRSSLLQHSMIIIIWSSYFSQQTMRKFNPFSRQLFYWINCWSNW